MSRLMAEMYNLHLAKEPLDGTFGFDSGLDEDTDQAVAEFVEKINNSQYNRHMQSVADILKSILQRVEIMLTAIDISPILPRPIIDIYRRRESAELSYRQPLPFFDESETNAEVRSRMNRLVADYKSTSKYRDQLLIELMEWFAATQISLQSDVPHTIKRHEIEQTRSLLGMLEAMDHASAALQRLQSIGDALFDDREEDEVESSSSLSGNVAARLNAQFHRTSVQLDKTPSSARASLLQTLFSSRRAIGERKPSKAMSEDDYEEEKSLIEDVGSNWEVVCQEILDTLIGVHGLRHLKRPSKLAMRRAIYMFKLLSAVLANRTSELKSKESELIKIMSESGTKQNKIDHLHKELKGWREKFAATQNRNAKLVKETNTLEQDLMDIKNLVLERDTEIVELEARLKAYEGEKESDNLATGSGMDSDRAAIAKRVKELKKRNRRQSTTIADLENELVSTTKKLKEAVEKEKKVGFDAKEETKHFEESLQETKTKLRLAEDQAQKHESVVEEKNDIIAAKDRELDSVQEQLKAKEAMIEKLAALEAADEKNDNSAVVPRRSSVWSRRDSLRRQSHMAIQNISSASLPVVQTPSNLVVEERGSSPLQFSSAKFVQVGVQVPSMDELSRESMSGQSEEGTIAAPRPTPTASEVSLSDPEEKHVKGRVQHRRSSGLTTVRKERRSVPYHEYKRVVTELQQSETLRKTVEKDIAELSHVLDEQEVKHERSKSIDERQHRIKLILEEEKLKSHSTKLYDEFVKIEPMINRFKSDLAAMLDKMLATTGAKLARNAYNYVSVPHPNDHVVSMVQTNQKLHGAFGTLLEAIAVGFQTMQNAQKETQIKADRTIGLETADHLKILSEKAKIIEDLKLEVDRYKSEVERVKQISAKRQERLIAELKALTNSKELTTVTLEEFQSCAPPLDKALTLETMEAMLKQPKEEIRRLKKKLADSELMLENERATRVRFEKILMIQDKPRTEFEGEMTVNAIRLTAEEAMFGERKSGAVRRATDMVSALTTTGKYVGTLDQIERIASHSKKKILEKELLDKMKNATSHWHKCASTRLAKLVQKYVQFRRLKEVQLYFESQILHQQELDLAASMAENVAQAKPALPKRAFAIGSGSDEKAVQQLTDKQRLQACYWQLDLLVKKLILRDLTDEQLDTIVNLSRNFVVSVFREVGFAVLDFRKKELLEQAMREARKEDLIPPSNSELSMTSHQSKTSQASMPAEEVVKDEEKIENDSEAKPVISISIKSAPPKALVIDETVKLNTVRWEAPQTENIEEKSENATDKYLMQPPSLKEHIQKRSMTGTTWKVGDALASVSKKLPEGAVHSGFTHQIHIKSDKVDLQQINFRQHESAVTSVHSLPERKGYGLAPTTTKVEIHDDFHPQFFGRRLASRSSDPRRASLAQAELNKVTFASEPLGMKTKNDEDSVDKWMRFESVIRKRQKSSTAATLTRDLAARNKHVLRDMPLTLEMDIRQDLRQVRKNIQHSMHHHLDHTGSHSSLRLQSSSDLTDESERHLRDQRRLTLAYLGVGVKSEITPIASNEILNNLKSRQENVETAVTGSFSSSSARLSDLFAADMARVSQRPTTSRARRVSSDDHLQRRPVSEGSHRPTSKSHDASSRTSTGIFLLDQRLSKAPRPIPHHDLSSSAHLPEQVEHKRLHRSSSRESLEH